MEEAEYCHRVALLNRGRLIALDPPSALFRPAVLRRMLHSLMLAARWLFRLRIRTDGPHPSRVADGPVIVMCRHAGPGDSFMLMYALLHWYHREPRVVLKNTLAWDPAIDVILNRVPARFISPNPAAGEDLESQIASLATQRTPVTAEHLRLGREGDPGSAVGVDGGVEA